MRVATLASLSILFLAAQLNANTIILDDGIDPVEVGEHAEFFEDTSGRMEIEEVSTRTDWNRPGSSSLSFGAKTSAIWLRFSVQQSSVDERVIEWTYPILDYVDLYVPEAKADCRECRTYRRFESGRMRPFANRFLDQKTINLRLPVTADASIVYVRVASESSLICQMKIWKTAALMKENLNETLFFGAYGGILLIMALYNLSLFFTVRDVNYLLYSLFVLSFLFFQAGTTGYTFQYLIPQNPLLYKQSVLFFYGISFAAAVAFSSTFLNLRQNAPWLFRAIAITTLLMLGIWTASFAKYILFPRYAVPLAVIGIACLLLGSVLSYRRGFRPARYYLIAWSGFLLAVLLWVVSRWGVLPVSFLTEHGLQVGSAFEVLLLSLALGDRINLMKEEKEAAQRETLERQVVLTKSYARFVPSEIMGLLERKSITVLHSATPCSER